MGGWTLESALWPDGFEDFRGSLVVVDMIAPVHVCAVGEVE